MKNYKQSGYLVTYFEQMKHFNRMKFTSDGYRILNTPNAGGSSIISETLSFEILKKYFNAKLLKTEMEVPYFPEGGSMNDYVVILFDSIIGNLNIFKYFMLKCNFLLLIIAFKGVSVTRAMKYKNEEFTIDDAYHLLKKKLNGIHQSSRNSLIKWDKQILHVWLMDRVTCRNILRAWEGLETALRSNTVLLITLAENSKEVFYNAKKK